MDSALSVLLRSGDHGAVANTVVRLALKCDQVTVAIARSPIQIGFPNGEPITFDLGINRPSVTISGMIDNIGGDLTNTTHNTGATDTVAQWYGGMEKISLTGPNTAFSAFDEVRDYYIPYKNYLEEKLVTWSTMSGVDLQLEIGDARYPTYRKVAKEGASRLGSGGETTGGAIYKVVVGNMQFMQAPGTEDRWTFSIQFPAITRTDTEFKT